MNHLELRLERWDDWLYSAIIHNIKPREKKLVYLLLIKPYLVPYFVTAHSKSYGSSISVSSFSVYPSSDTHSTYLRFNSGDFSLSQSSSSASTEIRISSSSSERPFSLYPSSSRSGLSFSPTSERSGLSTSPTSGKSSYNSRSYILWLSMTAFSKILTISLIKGKELLKKLISVSPCIFY